MRVLIAGRGPLAVRSAKLLALLTSSGQIDAEIGCIPVASDRRDSGWLASLETAAGEHGWALAPSVAAARLTEDDVLVSLQYDRIVDIGHLHGARAYNLHFAPLPRYRGCFTSYWPIRNGETTAGVTLHVLTERLDCGPIVATRLFELPVRHSAHELYEAYHAHGFDLLKDHLVDVIRGEGVVTDQDESLATYFGRDSVCFEDLELSDFDRPAWDVHNGCRALIFPPKQLPTFRGRSIVGCYPVECDVGDARPGTVVGELLNDVLVACGEGLVCLELLPESTRP